MFHELSFSPSDIPSLLKMPFIYAQILSVIHVLIHLSIHLPCIKPWTFAINLFLNFCVYPTVLPSIHPLNHSASVHPLSICVTLSLHYIVICPSFCPSINNLLLATLSVSHSTNSFFHCSINHPFIHAFVNLSINHLPIHLSIPALFWTVYSIPLSNH